MSKASSKSKFSRYRSMSWQPATSRSQSKKARKKSQTSSQYSNFTNIMPAKNTKNKKKFKSAIKTGENRNNQEKKSSVDEENEESQSRSRSSTSKSKTMYHKPEECCKYLTKTLQHRLENEHLSIDGSEKKLEKLPNYSEEVLHNLTYEKIVTAGKISLSKSQSMVGKKRNYEEDQKQQENFEAVQTKKMVSRKKSLKPRSFSIASDSGNKSLQRQLKLGSNSTGGSLTSLRNRTSSNMLNVTLNSWFSSSFNQVPRTSTRNRL